MANINSTQDVTIWSEDGQTAVTVDELSTSAKGLSISPLGVYTASDPSLIDGQVYPLRVSASGTLLVEASVTATNLDLRNLDESRDDVRVYSASGTPAIATYLSNHLDKERDNISVWSASGTQAIEVYNSQDVRVRLEGEGNAVRITDGDGHYADVTAAGRLQVSQEPPEPPVGTTSVIVTEYDDVSTTDDNVYTIPNGETLYIQRLSAGAESGNGGSVAELWYDPNGTGVGMTIIDAVHVDGSSAQHDLNSSYEGDGTRAIRLRRKRYGGGAVEIFARWEGYY